MDKPIFCLMGPTASGKTDLACELMNAFPLEIISVDSAMVYRQMDVGTAKPEPDILLKAPHHLIDIISPIESYSAAEFCQDTNQLIDDILSRGKFPLLVGGTMMYFNALQKGLSSLPTADAAIREQIEQEAKGVGWAKLHEKLSLVDPETAAKIHPNDTQRIGRALEVYRISGKPLSEHFKKDEEKRPAGHFVNLLLMPENRAWLHQRIELRFNQMLAAGMIDEVKALLDQWPELTLDYPSMRSVGYRQVYLYLQGEYDKNTLISKGVAATRQLAKRQLTWLRHWPDGESFIAEDTNVCQQVMAWIEKLLDNRPRI